MKIGRVIHDMNRNGNDFLILNVIVKKKKNKEYPEITIVL